jgi:hypothetical protein
MKISVILLLGMAFAQTSCILPIPHRRVHVSGLEGKVINRTTRAPITGAKVSSAFSGKPLATTDSAGKFRIKPVYGWHGAYLISPISYSLLPHFDIGPPPLSVRISAAGYQPREFGRREYSRDEFPLDPR